MSSMCLNAAESFDVCIYIYLCAVQNERNCLDENGVQIWSFSLYPSLNEKARSVFYLFIV